MFHSLPTFFAFSLLLAFVSPVSATDALTTSGQESLIMDSTKEFTPYFQQYRTEAAMLYHQQYVGREVSLKDFLAGLPKSDLTFDEWLAFQSAQYQTFHQMVEGGEAPVGTRALSFGEWINQQIDEIRLERAMSVGNPVSHPSQSFEAVCLARMENFLQDRM